MPRYIFPSGSVTNTTGTPLRLTFHVTNTTDRREGDLWTIDGSSNLLERIPNGVILTDVTGVYSAFAGPDDVDTLYVSKNDGASRTSIIATSLVTGQGGVYLNGTFVPASSVRCTITYNADGTVATVTETASGAVATFTYNADGTVATESRVLNGVTTLRTFSYSGGNLTGVS